MAKQEDDDRVIKEDYPDKNAIFDSVMKLLIVDPSAVVFWICMYVCIVVNVVFCIRSLQGGRCDSDDTDGGTRRGHYATASLPPLLHSNDAAPGSTLAQSPGGRVLSSQSDSASLGVVPAPAGSLGPTAAAASGGCAASA